MKATIYVPDIECDSCVKILNKSFKDLEGINSWVVKEDKVIFDYDDSKLSSEKLVKIIKDRDFRASLNPFERKTFRERIRDFKENPKKYALERRGVKYTLSVFFLLIILEVLSYWAFFNKVEGFFGNYAIWFFYLTISVVVIGGVLWHFYSYRAKVTCMVGMMIGMTVGMQTGMMIGAIVGATNGFFVGAMVGMIIGVIVGAITGTCCGVMGIMEGMMAGLMGGTMGPMISLMMFFDHLHWFMPLYILINIIILGGLSYMLFEEVIEHNQNVKKRPVEFVTFASICIIVMLVLSVVMVYGPKSSFVIGG